MSAQPTQAALHDDPGQQAADAHLYREALRDLISMGTDLARLLHGQATAQVQARAAQGGTNPQPAPAPAPGTPIPSAPIPDALVSIAAAFDRTARAVRRGVLLARSLARPVQPAHDPAGHRAAARRRILREVEDAIQRPGTSDERDGDGRGGDGRDGRDGLRAELRDRMDSPDLDDDITGRPVADIITDICRDLGLAALPGTRPWKRRTPEDIRQLCARAAAPSPTRHAGAEPQDPEPQDPGPQDPRQGAAQRTPGPLPDPAAIPRVRPAFIHAGSDPPEDPAAGIATIPRHPARPPGHWPPPPEA